MYMKENLISNFENIDCMEFMRSMENGSVDFTLTDIPFNFTERGDSTSIRNFDYGVANDLVFDLTEFLNEVYRVTKNSVCIFCGREQFSFISDFFYNKGKGTVRPIIWEKTNPLPLNGELNYLSAIELAVWYRYPNGIFNGKYKPNVFKYPVQASDKIKSHPTKKNVELFKELILDNTNPGDIVFDPCCGSGTTIEACLKSNRKFVACELDSTFYDMACKYLYQNYSMLLAMC